MTRNRLYNTPIALGSFTAAVALLAGLQAANAQAVAPGPALSGAGSFPQSFIVPGTSTSLHVGGFIQLDARYDMSAVGNADSPGANDNLAPSSVEVDGNGFAAPAPGHHDHGVFRMTAQNTRFSVETRTPSAYGEIKTFIEIDFAGNQSTGGALGTVNTSVGGSQTNFNQTSLARIKQGYGTLGPFLFGMTNSNFADLAAWNDTLDAPVEAGGFMGAGQVKVQQARYTYLFANGISASASIESNQTGGIVGTSTGANPNIGIATGLSAAQVALLNAAVPGLGLAATGFSGIAAPTPSFNDFNSPGITQKIPALTGTVQIQQPWGHAGFHAVIAQARVSNDALTLIAPATASGNHIAKWGYMLSQTGHLNTIGQDRLTWQATYGQGASNYTWATNDLGTQWEEDLVCSTNAATLAASTSLTCSQPRVMGINVGYSHHWNDLWRSNLALGYDQTSRPNAAATWLTAAAGNEATNLERKHYSVDTNVFWAPTAGVQFGIEYEWYHRTVWSGAHGSSNRVESQALFSF